MDQSTWTSRQNPRGILQACGAGCCGAQNTAVPRLKSRTAQNEPVQLWHRWKADSWRGMTTSSIHTIGVLQNKYLWYNSTSRVILPVAFRTPMWSFKKVFFSTWGILYSLCTFFLTYTTIIRSYKRRALRWPWPGCRARGPARHVLMYYFHLKINKIVRYIAPVPGYLMAMVYL